MHSWCSSFTCNAHTIISFTVWIIRFSFSRVAHRIVITVRDLFSRSTLFNHICRLPGWRKVHTSLYASHILWPRCVLTHKHAVMDTTCSQFARTRSCFCICTYFQCLSMSFPYSNAPRNASKERCQNSYCIHMCHSILIQQCSSQCIQRTCDLFTTPLARMKVTCTFTCVD